MSSSSGRAGTGKVLCVSRRRVVGQPGVIPKCIRAAEQAGEKVEDAIEVKVETEFPVAATLQVRDVVNELNSLDGRLARAEVVAANAHVGACARPDDCF